MNNWNAYGMQGPQWQGGWGQTTGYPDDPNSQSHPPALGLGGMQRPQAGPPGVGPAYNQHAIDQMTYGNYMPGVGPASQGGGMKLAPEWQPYGGTGGYHPMMAGGPAMLQQSAAPAGGGYPMQTGGVDPSHSMGGYPSTGGNDPSHMVPGMGAGGNLPPQAQAHFMGQNTGVSRPQMPMNGWGRFMQSRPLVN